MPGRSRQSRVRYATAHNQLNLTDDELRFIAKYPEQVRQILTITP